MISEDVEQNRKNMVKKYPQSSSSGKPQPKKKLMCLRLPLRFI